LPLDELTCARRHKGLKQVLDAFIHGPLLRPRAINAPYFILP
jgi:hypothetical protein